MKGLKVLLVVAVLLLGVSSFVLAEQIGRSAVIAQVSGKVEVKNAGSSWKPAAVGSVLKQGDIVRTLANSSALINLDGEIQSSTIELKQNGQLAFAELFRDNKSNSQNTLLDLSLGEVLIKTKKLQAAKSRFEVKTPTSIVGVRGTVFSVSVEAVQK